MYCCNNCDEEMDPDIGFCQECYERLEDERNEALARRDWHEERYKSANQRAGDWRRMCAGFNRDCGKLQAELESTEDRLAAHLKTALAERDKARELATELVQERQAIGKLLDILCDKGEEHQRGLREYVAGVEGFAGSTLDIIKEARRLVAENKELRARVKQLSQEKE